jgi:hypothetical protein
MRALGNCPAMAEHPKPDSTPADLERRLRRYRARAVAEGRSAAVVQIDRAIAEAKRTSEPRAGR